MAGALSFHRLEVKSVERIAEDAACLTLAIPASLRDEFKHDAGQYLTVRRVIDGREERRTYSIVTAPGGSTLRLGVRAQFGGRMSRELTGRVRPGDTLEVGRPLGRFRTAIDPGRTRSYVAFAAGSGITPVLSLAIDILAREPHSRFTLIYGNRTMARTMFLEDILALKNRYMGRFSLYFVMSREPQHTALLNGRIDAAKVEALAGDIVEIASADEYFVCGPGGMVDEVRGAIKRLNGAAPVRFERFTTSSPASSPERDIAQGREARTADAPSGATRPQATRSSPGAPGSGPQAPVREVLATISVLMDGRRRSFTMAAEDASVLEAGEHAGLELPFSCRSGICATCRAKIVGGAAVMAHNIALEPWETAAGFVLCCQARPTTPTLELSYDEK
ncbi:MAG TPA: 2Fe-2S iron-sulfur cluster-binding protein [Steroidobacteraceae bacterium]|nr:2Fe-2S iron-sulfur cluster-binding protein [Steroidobacteraceae bacterium]